MFLDQSRGMMRLKDKIPTQTMAINLTRTVNTQINS